MFPLNGLIAALLTLLVAGCSTTAPAPESTESEIGILVFGDSGYHLSYPDQDDYETLFSQEQYEADEWDEWLEDKRPPEEFKARPSAVSPITQHVVPATGLHAVSSAMQDYCANYERCDFGVMLGDNIYPSGATLGADGFNDAARLDDVMGDPFGSLVQDPATYTTYVTLGNHDWETSREGGFAQIRYLEAHDGFYMDGPFYKVKPPAGNGEIELFVVDTSMILANTTVYKDILADDGSEVETDIVEPADYFTEPQTDAERNQVAWLEQALRESDAKWKFVVAHHPIWSSAGSKFQEARALRTLILPAMCKYADGYLVGHDHTLEIHTDSCETALGAPTPTPLVQAVSGAAAKQRPLNTAFMKYQANKYPEHKTVYADALLWGFMHLQVKGDTATLKVMSVPDDGSSDISIDYTYEFARRSHLIGH